MSIRLNLLGVPSCRIDDVELPELPAQKARFALLTYLAVERNASRDEVATLFWSDSDDDRARHALSQSIYELKRLLGDGWIQSQAGRLIVSDDVVVDVLDFNRLCAAGTFDRATALYRGPFLSGFYLSNSKGFETWVDRQRSLLERAHRRAHREYVNQLMEANRTPIAIEVARRWVELDPFEDEANHKLIELLAQSGNRTDALRAYTAYEKRLRDELSIEPLEHTKRLVEEIRAETAIPRSDRAIIDPGIPGPDLSAVSPISIEPPPLIKELLKRRVLRMALWYAATSFAIIQFAQTMQEAFHLSSWVLTTTAILAIAGFPVAVLLSWHFDLTAEGVKRAQSSPGMSRRSIAVFVAVVVLGGALWISGFKRGVSSFGPSLELDSTRFAILPFRYADNIGSSLNEDQLMQDALRGWGGISVVDLFQIRSALPERAGDLGPDEALRVARTVGAGRYIRGDVSRFQDSLRIHATLYNAQNAGNPIIDRSVRVPISLAGLESAFAALADALLVQSEPGVKGSEAPVATTSLPARRAFDRAMTAIRDWNLAQADSLLAAAIAADQDFAQGFLWLAQVRAWTRSEVPEWQYAAQHASADSARLPVRDRRLAQGIEALSRGDYPAACKAYRELTVSDPHAFAAWYGFADCLHRDNAVVADPASPSGYAFRTSYAEVIRAYTKAFHIMPSIHKALHGNSYQRIRRLLFTGARDQRPGKAVNDTTRFQAYATWANDSLQMIPFRAFDALRPGKWWNPESTLDAVKHQRSLFHQIASGWVAAFPKSPEAIEAVAVALEMLGNPSALDTLRRARALTTDAKQRTRLAVNEVFVQLKFSLPNDLEGIKRARRLADSLLSAERVDRTQQPRMLASVAALMGRAKLSAAFNQSPASLADMGVQPEIGRFVLALESYASLGGPPDSLRLLDARTEAAIHNNIMREDQAAVRAAFLLRLAALSLPAYRFATNDKLLAEGYPTLAMASAAAEGDAQKVREVWQRDFAVRSQLRAADIGVDALLPEAWSLLKVGDAHAARAWLEPTLLSTRFTAPGLYATDPVLAGALSRAIVLMADIANRANDPNAARQWANVASVLWSDCDDFLKPTLRRMKSASSEMR